MVKSPIIEPDISSSPIQDASAIQQRAAQPNASIWVSASAGTGKTKVLTDRVLNLLLRGIPPRKILCLTYTRAAATEMTLRLLQRLSRWATLADNELEKELITLQAQSLETTPQKVQAKHFRRARQLFIDVLNTPGGLNIQTIHSFCQSVLQKFPMEASIPPNFEVADPDLTQQLLEASLHELFIDAQTDAHLMRCLEFVSARLSLVSVAERLREMLMKPLALRALQTQGLTPALKKLYTDLKIKQDQSWPDYLQDYYADTPCADLLACISALQQGGMEDKDRAQVLQLALGNADAFINNFESYVRAFLTQDGQIRARLASKKVQSQNNQVLSLLMEEAERLSQLMVVQKSYTIAHQSEVWMTLGLWIFERYNLKKQEQGLLDYDDLITKTYELLHKPGLAPFVLYKLDGGIHHILVDEAQDTSPLQWGLIAALVEEFFSGQGSIGGTTSLFAVGDFKQSIYSFQGAEPYLFHQMRNQFAGKVEAAQQQWQNLEMQISFRSTPAVLKAVDSIFANLQASQGVMDPGVEKIQHQSFMPTGAGLVELWPLAPGNPEGESDDVSSSRKPEDRVAEVIARQIRKWLDSKTMLEAKGRLITPGDILILVQRRNHFIYAMMRALKKENIPTAGIDRLELMEHIAVQDLLALCQFLLLHYFKITTDWFG
jgi:ATP-dependent helicase/nuclease subunit A